MASAEKKLASRGGGGTLRGLLFVVAWTLACTWEWRWWMRIDRFERTDSREAGGAVRVAGAEAGGRGAGRGFSKGEKVLWGGSWSEIMDGGGDGEMEGLACAWVFPRRLRRDTRRARAHGRGWRCEAR